MPQILCLVLLFFLKTHLFAGTNDTLVVDYMPYLNQQPWPLIPVTAYVQNTSNVWVNPVAPDKYPTFQEIREDDADFYVVFMRLPNGSIFKTYSEYNAGAGLCAVYSADLNHDGIPDFVLVQPTTGCGLAGEQYVGVFAFSDHAQYYFTRVRSWGLGPQNIVVDPKTKDFRLIQSTFHEGQSVDGQYHSFWVHRFFKWDDGGFREDTDLPPVWIQYLYRPNHEPTQLLTPELKTKIWLEDLNRDCTIEFWPP